MVRLVLLVCGLLGMVSTVQAQSAAGSGVSVQISRESVTMMAGDWANFETVLQNNGTAATPPLAVHLSIAAVETGHHVDPEDWSPARTQFLPSLSPGESLQLNWELHALFEGEFTAFVTVVSADGAFASTMGRPLRMHVTADNILPMSKVIPVVTAVPFLPLGLLLITGLYRRKQ
jgi:hypothetical protein